jgi:hypothetical protein
MKICVLRIDHWSSVWNLSRVAFILIKTKAFAQQNDKFGSEKMDVVVCLPLLVSASIGSLSLFTHSMRAGFSGCRTVADLGAPEFRWMQHIICPEWVQYQILMWVAASAAMGGPSALDFFCWFIPRALPRAVMVRAFSAQALSKPNDQRAKAASS